MSDSLPGPIATDKTSGSPAAPVSPSHQSQTVRRRRAESIDQDAADSFPVRFEWAQPCESVGITGSFNSWGSQILLKKLAKQKNAVGVVIDEDDCEQDDEDPDAGATSSVYAAKLYLPAGTYYFRFCVDGNWVYDPEVVFAGDEYGNLNNFVRVFALVDAATGKKVVQSPVPTMIRDSPTGLPLMNPAASEELVRLRAQASPSRRPPHSPPMAPVKRHAHDHPSVSDPPPLLTSLRPPQETQDSEYGLDVDGQAIHHSHGHGHSLSHGHSHVYTHSTSGRGRAGTLTRSHSDESLGHNASGHDIMTPKYVNHVNDSASASVLLAATTQNFGGDLVTKEHHERAQQGGHRSSLVVTQQGGSEKFTSKRTGKLMIFLVGLPGRGKTFIAHTLARHLTWMGHHSKIFNSGEYRRRLVGATVSHDFWDPNNVESAAIRTEIARQALDDSIAAMENGECDCAIFDATNATRNRRRLMVDELQRRYKCEVMFIESVYNQADIISASVNEMKLNSADYAGRTLEETEDDYRHRIQHYFAVYEPMDADSEKLSFIKVTDIGRQIFCNQVYGYLQSRIMFLMANLNLKPRPIWLSRHGESMYNTQKRIGGDAPLSPLGVQYAMQLDRFVDTYYPTPDTELAVWTSTMLRTGMTVERIAARGRTVVKWKQLDEIDAGVCDGMTYEQVADDLPDEYLARKNNKLHYRYPRGESYQDVIHRLEPVIMELMRIDKPVLIVAHQAILRVLYAYLTNKAPAECPTLNIPLHVVIQVTPKAYRCEEVWHRPM